MRDALRSKTGTRTQSVGGIRTGAGVGTCNHSDHQCYQVNNNAGDDDNHVHGHH